MGAEVIFANCLAKASPFPRDKSSGQIFLRRSFLPRRFPPIVQLSRQFLPRAHSAFRPPMIVFSLAPQWIFQPKRPSGFPRRYTLRLFLQIALPKPSPFPRDKSPGQILLRRSFLPRRFPLIVQLSRQFLPRARSAFRPPMIVFSPEILLNAPSFF